MGSSTCRGRWAGSVKGSKLLKVIVMLPPDAFGAFVSTLKATGAGDKIETTPFGDQIDIGWGMVIEEPNETQTEAEATLAGVKHGVHG